METSINITPVDEFRISALQVLVVLPEIHNYSIISPWWQKMNMFSNGPYRVDVGHVLLLI